MERRERTRQIAHVESGGDVTRKPFYPSPYLLVGTDVRSVRLRKVNHGPILPVKPLRLSQTGLTPNWLQLSIKNEVVDQLLEALWEIVRLSL